MEGLIGMVLLPDHVQLLDVGRKKAIKLVIKDDNTEDKVKVKVRTRTRIRISKNTILLLTNLLMDGVKDKDFKNNDNKPSDYYCPRSTSPSFQTFAPVKR